MRSLWMLLLLSCPAGFALPCGVASLAAYVAGPCEHFGITFSPWSYSAGTTGVAATDVLVMPSVTGPVFEITYFDPVGWAVGPGGSTAVTFSFLATGTEAVTGSRFLLGGGETSGIVGVMDECFDGLLLSACSLPAIKRTLGVSSPIEFIFDSNSFGPGASTIDVAITMTLSGFSGGSNFTSIQAGFTGSPVPEGSTFWLGGLLIAGLIGARAIRASGNRRRHRPF